MKWFHTRNSSARRFRTPRLATDPGGENQVILFKSCFPNSALEGQPDDPPDAQPGLTVGHAKYVYNLILGYFGLRGCLETSAPSA